VEEVEFNAFGMLKLMQTLFSLFIFILHDNNSDDWLSIEIWAISPNQIIYWFLSYEPTQADVSVFNTIPAPPPAGTKYPHVARWYIHILSYTSSFGTLPAGEVPTVDADPQAEDDDDLDLFGSDEEEDAEAEKLKAQRLADYQAKKAAKPKVIAKSVVTLDVKPWDDTTNMKELEQLVKGVNLDGLVWGTSKLVPVGYGINKLQINCVIVDDKVGVGK
jgi:elongation factor 1-beta